MTPHRTKYSIFKEKYPTANNVLLCISCFAFTIAFILLLVDLPDFWIISNRILGRCIVLGVALFYGMIIYTFTEDEDYD